MNRPPHSAPIEVLLVEDDPNDAELTIRALQGAKLRNRVQVARDGVEALDFLARQVPDLILFDLNLPKADGREVLAHVKGDDRLRRVPVIVVTSSQAEEDVAKASRLSANAYITKPIDPALFLKTVNAIGQFWLEIVKLP